MAALLSAPLLAVLLSCAPLLCFPATILLEVYAGATLPFWPAVLLVLTAKFVSAAGVYAVARSPLQPVVRGCLLQYRRYEVLQLGAAKGGWKFVLLARLSPLPGFVVNFALWQVPFRDFLWPTIGALPVVLQTVYLGHLLHALAALPPPTLTAVGSHALLWLGLLVYTAVLRKVRRVCYSVSGLEILPDTFSKSPFQLLLDDRQPKHSEQRGQGEGDPILEVHVDSQVEPG